MKTILTLLMAFCAVGTLQAQSREETRRIIFGERKENESNDRDNRDVVYGRSGNERYPGRNSDNHRYEIDKINRDYDEKINSIRNNRYLSNSEKERTIRQLEQDRQVRLSEVNRSVNNRNRHYDDDDRYEKNKNGKRKGWYKKNKNKNWRKGNRD